MTDSGAEDGVFCNKFVLYLSKQLTMKDTFIFDLDGTLALIDRRRARASQGGKIDWKVFFDPELVKTDEPNESVICVAHTLRAQGFRIVIFSGRSESTQEVTLEWLKLHQVEFDQIRMRPVNSFVPDEQLKASWLAEDFPGDQQQRIVGIFDDRDKVVDMWRSKGITCFQVAPGDF